MKNINYKSDFDFIMRLRDCKDPEKTVEWPEGDFEAVFWAGSKANSYRAGRRGGVCENCFPTEDGGMHFVFDKHRLGVGTLKWEPHFELANVIYPDGKEDVYSKEPLGIELVDGPGDCPTTAEVEALVPFIKFKYEDLTDEEKAEISKPATDAAASVRELEKSVRAAENERVANETARIGAENARELAEQTRQANEQDRTEAEALREVAEEERNDAEERRAEEFAGWEGEMDSKADRSELSNVLAEEPLDAGNFPDIGTYTREELKKDLFIDMWNSVWTVKCCFNHLNDPLTDRVLGKYDPENAPDAQHPFRAYDDVWLTYEEALQVIKEYQWAPGQNNLSGCLQNAHSRVAVPFTFGAHSQAINLASIAVYNDDIEEVCFAFGPYTWGFQISKLDTAFHATRSKLRKIHGILPVQANCTFNGWVSGAVNLESFRLYGLAGDISVSSCPKLDLETFRYMITKAANTKAITITVHPEVYAKIGDEANEEWHALLDKAASKNITIASA